MNIIDALQSEWIAKISFRFLFSKFPELLLKFLVFCSLLFVKIPNYQFVNVFRLIFFVQVHFKILNYVFCSLFFWLSFPLSFNQRRKKSCFLLRKFVCWICCFWSFPNGLNELFHNIEMRIDFNAASQNISILFP